MRKTKARKESSTLDPILDKGETRVERLQITHGLTKPQAVFVNEYIATGDKNYAIERAYEPSSPEYRSTIGSRLSKSDNVKRALNDELDAVGLNQKYLLEKLKGVTDADVRSKTTASDVLKGIELAFNLRGTQTKPTNQTETNTQEIELYSKDTKQLEEMLLALRERNNELNMAINPSTTNTRQEENNNASGLGNTSAPAVVLRETHTVTSTPTDS